ncbi:hypothetical protein KF840_20260 [bacterium]|nr:hypothetical protein [bacterium]
MRQSPFALLVLVTALAMGAPPAHAGDAAGERAMRLYRDPDTGVVGRPSAAALQAEAAAAPASAAAEQPGEEEAVQAPAGGVKVNLRGSHRPAVVRHADPGGPALHECIEGEGGR